MTITTEVLCADTVEISSDGSGPPTPASMVLKSYSEQAAAPIATVNSPLPPVGTIICLQLNIAGDNAALEGGIDIRYTIGPSDTPETVAAGMANWLLTGDDAALAAAAGISAEVTAGTASIAFTNTAPNLVVLSDQTFAVTGGAVASAFTIEAGSAAWDAGPVFGLRKWPGAVPGGDSTGGGAPPVGSNIGQIFAAALLASGVDAQYLTIGFNVIDPTTGSAEFAIYTKNTGAAPPLELFRVNETGCWALGTKIA